MGRQEAAALKKSGVYARLLAVREGFSGSAPDAKSLWIEQAFGAAAEMPVRGGKKAERKEKERERNVFLSLSFFRLYHLVLYHFCFLICINIFLSVEF